MSELRDFELESQDGDGSPKRGGERGRPAAWVWIAAVAIVLVLIGAWLFFRGSESESHDAAAAEEQAEVEAEPGTGEMEQPPVVILPTLPESDAWMRAVVGQLSSHPELAEWLVTDELINRFTAAVNNVAEGNSPRRQVDFMAPDGAFRAKQMDGQTVIDPASYARFDLIVDVAESLDMRGTAELYRSVSPLLEESYANLGYPDRTFQQTLTRAINQLLSTPIVEGAPELEPGVSSFEFADPRLEGLSDAQKQFLRLGPENLGRLQIRARRLALAIGIPEEDLQGASG